MGETTCSQCQQAPTNNTDQICQQCLRANALHQLNPAADNLHDVLKIFFANGSLTTNIRAFELNNQTLLSLTKVRDKLNVIIRSS